MQIGFHARSESFPRRSARGALYGHQAHFVRQIDAATRLAPAEAYRGNTAVLLCCADPVATERAERALRAIQPLDAVHAVRCPIQSWEQAVELAPGAVSWLQRFVMRQVDQRDPALLAVLEPGPADDDGEDVRTHALVSLLRRWGAASPIAVLRVRADREVEWLVTPGAVLDPTG